MNYFLEVLQDAKDAIQDWEQRWFALAGENETPFILNYRNKVDYFFNTRLPQIHEADGRVFLINPIVDGDNVKEMRSYGANQGDYYNVTYLSNKNKIINFIIYPFNETTGIDIVLIEKIAAQIDSGKIKHLKNPQMIEFGFFSKTQVGVWTIPQAKSRGDNYGATTKKYSANLSESCVRNYDIENAMNYSSFSVKLMTPKGRIPFPIRTDEDAVPDQDIVSQSKAELRNILLERVTNAVSRSIAEFKTILEKKFGYDISFIGSAEAMNFCLNSNSSAELRGKLELLKTYPFLNYYVNSPVYYQELQDEFTAHEILNVDIAPSSIGKSATIEGMKVAPVLAFQSGTNEAIISRVMGLTESYYRTANEAISRGSINNGFKDSPFLKLLTLCPIGGLPKYSSNPDQFVEVSNALIASNVLLTNKVDEGFKSNFIKSSISDAANIGKKYGADVKAIKEKTKDAYKDYIGYLANKLILPTIYRRSLGKINVQLWNENHGNRIANLNAIDGSISERIKNALLQDLFEFKGLATLLEYSDTMHERFTAIEHEVNDPDISVGWAKLIEDTDVPENLMGVGYKYICLNTTELLQDEGSSERMNHCVGGYSKDCYAGKSHIISVRDSRDKSMFTMQVIEKHITDAETQITRVEVYLGQARGYDNNKTNPMPPQQKAAADWLVDAINSKKVKVDFKAIKEAREKYKDDGLTTIIGFSPRDTERHNLAFREIHKQRLLHRKLKTLEDLLNMPRISKEIEAISKALLASRHIERAVFDEDLGLDEDFGIAG